VQAHVEAELAVAENGRLVPGQKLYESIHAPTFDGRGPRGPRRAVFSRGYV
jgi:hypothetical protein